MCGIYCVKNKINGKMYIGQSKNIEKRWKEHIRRSNSVGDTYFHKSLKKYGKENFEFSVLKECTENPDELNRLEEYYIANLKTKIPNGYNMTPGGQSTIDIHGENNPNSRLTKSAVFDIREMYFCGMKKSDAYQAYRDVISMNTFADVWNGKTWRHVHCDVYTNETRELHKHLPAGNHFCKLTIDDVKFIHECKRLGMKKGTVLQKYYPQVNYNTFSDAWYGKTYKKMVGDLIDDYVEVDKAEQYKDRSGLKNVMSNFTYTMIEDILTRKNNGESIRRVHKDYLWVERHVFSDLWYGRTYKELFKQICNDYPR